MSTFTAAQFGVLAQEQVNSSSSTRLSHGYTALHHAAQNNNVQSTSLLLEQKNTHVDGVPKLQGGCGATPLHRASFTGAYDCMKLLIDHGANLFALDESFGDLMTPLHKAISGGRSNAVQLLLYKLEEFGGLEKALGMKDSQGRNCLKLSDQILREFDETEKSKSVARWNKTAGSPPDWKKCLDIIKTVYLQAGFVKNITNENDGMNTHYNEIGSLSSSATVTCTLSTSHLGNFALPNNNHRNELPSTENITGLNPKSDHGVGAQERQISKDFNDLKMPITIPNTGKLCDNCKALTILLFRSKDKKFLFCKSCKRKRK